MNRRKIIKKIKPFWKDTEAISPVVATILILAVAVAAGVGLYFWFDTFQEGAQAQVGDSSSASMNIMTKNSLGNDAITLSPLPGDWMYTITFAEQDDFDSAPKDEITGDSLYPQGNGYIGMYRKYNPTYFLTSTSGGNGWINSSLTKALIYDERFIVEIPITITPVVDLNNVYIKAGTPVVSEKYPETDATLFHSEYWLHLDRDNNYELLKKDETPFIGTMKRKSGTSSTIEEVTTSGQGDRFYFNGEDYFLTVDPTKLGNFKGENMGDDFANVETTNGTTPIYPGWPSYDSGTFFRVLPLYKANGETGYAYKMNITSADKQGFYTNYFYGSTSIGKYFSSNQYIVGDMNKGQSVTKYVYLMFDSLRMPKCPDSSTTWLEGDDEYVVFDVPITVMSTDGVTSTMTVKIKVHDEE